MLTYFADVFILKDRLPNQNHLLASLQLEEEQLNDDTRLTCQNNLDCRQYNTTGGIIQKTKNTTHFNEAGRNYPLDHTVWIIFISTLLV